MEIFSLNLYNPIKTNFSNLASQKQGHSPSVKKSSFQLCPIKKDTVSFKGRENTVKKSNFSGIDFNTVEKFRVDISKFNSVDDLQKWAMNKVSEITQKDFGGRQNETTVQRKSMLKEWIEYVVNENDTYTPVMKFVILDSITKDLKQNNDVLPPVLNKRILADTMDDTVNRLKNFPKSNINFSKLYQTKLNQHYWSSIGDDAADLSLNGWIVIPSLAHDSVNFKENVDRLKALSHNNWCTKSFAAESYLSKGDFHIYFVNGKPKLGVRFENDAIAEIQGEVNNSKIPLDYYDVVKQHIDNDNYNLSLDAKFEIQNAEKMKEKVKIFKDIVGEKAIKECDVDKILPYWGIDYEKDENGFVSLKEYKPINPEYTFEDIGVDIDKLFCKIKEIKGDACFAHSKLTSLGALKKVGGNVDLRFSIISDLGNLEEVGGNIDFGGTRVTNLGKLRYIGGNAIFSESKITSLNRLQHIGGDAHLSSSIINDLGDLQVIGKNAFFSASDIKDLKNLKSIGGNAYLYHCKVENLGELETIGGNAYFNNLPLTSLNKLKHIGDCAYFDSQYLTNIGRLESIEQDAYLYETEITPNLLTNIVKGNIEFKSK